MVLQEKSIGEESVEYAGINESTLKNVQIFVNKTKYQCYSNQLSTGGRTTTRCGEKKNQKVLKKEKNRLKMREGIQHCLNEQHPKFKRELDNTM